MNFKLATFAAAGLFTFTLSACSQTPSTMSDSAKEPTKAAISEAAQQALAKAEADVKMAKAKFALWTSAEKALDQAQEAAKAGDSAAVIKQAEFVSGQVQGGLAQLSYPSAEQK